jgi:NarL family two-component system response regulator LiaR
VGNAGLTDPVSVVLVEDHALTRAGLRAALEAVGFEVVGEAGDGISGEDVIVRERPAVAVVDIGLPGRDGIALTRAVGRSAPHTRIVILTMHEIGGEVLQALSAGAAAYCVKSSDATSIIEAVRIVARGGAYFDPRIANVVMQRFGAAGSSGGCPLTVRELDVLRLVVDGLRNAEIAAQLHLGLGTIKGHVRDILEKLSATDRTQAAATAIRKGYL